MKTTTPTRSKVVAGTGIRPAFKPSFDKRKVKFATPEQVRLTGASVDQEFAGAFKILAK
jgi:hypothetical protein